MMPDLQTYLIQDCRLDRSRPVLAGISGGPDSLCLLDVLHNLGYPLVVAHLNHGFRPEADEEARLLEEKVRGMGLPFVGGVADAPAFAEQEKLSREEAARILRYRFLFNQARLFLAQAVAVGHTLDDQAETVLLHLLRGTGLAGLSGMRPWVISEWDSQIPLVRPLLAISHQATLDYCRDHNLVPFFDQSNNDPVYLRNRVRGQLLPLLGEYNPRIRESLARTAAILAEEESYLDGATETAWLEVAEQASPFQVRLKRGAFRDQPLALQRRLVRQAYACIQPNLRELDFDTVERVCAAGRAEADCSGMDLAGAVRLITTPAALVITAGDQPVAPAGLWPQVDPATPLRIDRSGLFPLGSDWWIEVKRVSSAEIPPPAQIRMADPFQAWLTTEGLELPFLLRGRAPGDRFSPFGMAGHRQKLSDFMVNEKIPQVYRGGWPLVCRGEEIIWVTGYRPAEEYRIRPEDRSAWHLRVFSLSGAETT